MAVCPGRLESHENRRPMVICSDADGCKWKVGRIHCRQYCHRSCSASSGTEASGWWGKMRRSVVLAGRVVDTWPNSHYAGESGQVPYSSEAGCRASGETPALQCSLDFFARDRAQDDPWFCRGCQRSLSSASTIRPRRGSRPVKIERQLNQRINSINLNQSDGAFGSFNIPQSAGVRKRSRIANLVR